MADYPYRSVTSELAAQRRAVILQRLVEAAARGEMCPNNTELSAMAGFKSPPSANKALRDLTEEGQIEVRHFGNFYRQVVILADGTATAPRPERAAEARVRPQHTVREIVDLVVGEANTCRKSVLAGSRYHDHLRARQMAQALALRVGWGVTHIARALSVDHSTVKSNARAIVRHALREPATAALLARCTARMQPEAAA